MPAPGGPTYERLRALMRSNGLHTICEEAGCPNIGECWEQGTATFLILGDICTRACLYCDVVSGRPHPLDPLEPYRVAVAVKSMALKHAVITSVDRDDLADGGAQVFAETIRQVRRLSPLCTIEVLIPDYMGDALRTVMDERPDVLNHNIETVERVFPLVRAKGRYQRSIELLGQVKELDLGVTSKSGIILGMGEEREEVIDTLWDLREAEVDVVTIGQYLRPSSKHLPVSKFWTPEEFTDLKAEAVSMGFKHAESGPLVRSSYHARGQIAVALG